MISSTTAKKSMDCVTLNYGWLTISMFGMGKSFFFISSAKDASRAIRKRLHVVMQAKDYDAAQLLITVRKSHFA